MLCQKGDTIVIELILLVPFHHYLRWLCRPVILGTLTLVKGWGFEVLAMNFRKYFILQSLTWTPFIGQNRIQ